jgi:hypothetical protein
LIGIANSGDLKSKLFTTSCAFTLSSASAFLERHGVFLITEPLALFVVEDGDLVGESRYPLPASLSPCVEHSPVASVVLGSHLLAPSCVPLLLSQELGQVLLALACGARVVSTWLPAIEPAQNAR